MVLETTILSSIEFQMSLLLFVALAGYLAASRFNQSAVIGEILVGIIIGPSILGLITYTDFVKSIATMGAVVLLFVIGMEFKLKEIFNGKYGLIAFFGVILPWIAGYYLAKGFGFDFPSAVFVAAALTATSVAITAQVLKELNLLKEDFAKAIIGAAVIDDILGIMSLSMSKGLATGSLSLGYVGIIFLKAIAFLVIGYLIGQFLLRNLIMKTDETKIAKRYPEFVFIFAMMIAFLYAMFAEMIGLSAIIGSFIAGVCLGSMVLKNSRHFQEGSEFLVIILASVFFVSLGILANIRELTLSTIVFMAVLTIVAIATKLIGCGVSAKMVGMKTRSALIIGVGMAPRGEVAMIIALIGLNQGIIGQNIYVSLVMMSLITTIITPIALKYVLGKDEKNIKVNKLKIRID
ncbi:MAG: cation:proton antiporter [Nanoarchaeota archaeon]|nr:cation:proton antiporter [Nanoarchaeota archaeon]